MSSPIEIAINNFVDHCQAIPNSLGSSGTQTPAFSTNQHTLNIPYPHGITVGDGSNSDTQFNQIRQLLAARPPNVSTSVVDSYSALDLTPLGFEILFETPWFYRLEGAAVPSRPVDVARVESVNTPQQLQEFDRAAAIGFGHPDADVVYSTPLLRDHRYNFYFIRQSNQIVAGVQTFTNEESLGIYTLFTLLEHRRKGYGSALVSHAIGATGGIPAITNPGDESDQLFRNLGFVHIGTRTIWRRQPD